MANIGYQYTLKKIESARVITNKIVEITTNCLRMIDALSI